MRSAQYDQGRRNGIKGCVEWLHDRAAEMNDPHARAILNSAAFEMGRQFKDGGACIIRASPRSSEGQPTGEGRRANTESHAQSIKGEDHGK